jgi:hypothetical protein
MLVRRLAVITLSASVGFGFALHEQARAHAAHNAPLVGLAQSATR